MSEQMDTSQNGDTKEVLGGEEVKQEKIEVEEDEPELIENEVTLSWYDSDLNLTIDKETLRSAKPVCEGRFARIWAGARATHGFTEGKVCFQVRLLEQLDVSDCIYIKREIMPHLIRVGWSTFDTSLQLGEDPLSYCFDSSGKTFENCKLQNYGKLFNKRNDVITTYLDFTGDAVSLSFSLNDTDMGVAYTIPKASLQGKSLAPHILTKNIKFEVNFGQVAPWGTVNSDFIFVGNIPLEDRARGPRAPSSREECEVILVCGLPASGKTYWANNHSQAHPNKRYTIIGISALTDKMKVMGAQRKIKTDVYEGPNVKCLEKLMHIGCHRRRNFILDQTSWKRKIRNFENFIQKGVIIVPPLEEYRRRVQKQLQEGERYVSDSDTYDVTSKFTLPEPSMFNEVIYPELGAEELQSVMDTVTSEAKEKFAKIAAEAKLNAKTRQGQKDRPQNLFRPGGGLLNNPNKRMKGNFLDTYSTSYPLKRPMPHHMGSGFRGLSSRPVIPPPPRGSMMGPRGGPSGHPRGNMNFLGPPSFRSGNSGPPGGYGGPRLDMNYPPQRRSGPAPRMPPMQSPPGRGIPGDGFRPGPNPWATGGPPSPLGDMNGNGDYFRDEGDERSDWGRWWNSEGRKMYGRWLAQSHGNY